MNQAAVTDTHWTEIQNEHELAMLAPGLAGIHYCPRLLERVEQLWAAVLSVRASLIEDFDGSCEWTQWADDETGETIPGEPMRVEYERLVVDSAGRFWYAAEPRGTAQEITTAPMSVEELRRLVYPSSGK